VPETPEIQPESVEPEYSLKEDFDLRYPIDQNYYQAEIRFSVYEVDNDIAELDLSLQLGDNKADDEKSNKANGEQISNLGVDELLKGSTSSKYKKVEGRDVSLYLPAGLAFNDGVSYDQVNIGTLGIIAEGMMGSKKGNMLSDLGKNATDILENLGKGAGGGGDLGKLINAKIASFGGEGIGGAVSGALRVKENPHTRVLFGSVPIREFQFAFQFLPTSKKEVKAIHKIIRVFREELYPRGIAKVGNTYNGFDYPNVFKIEFFYQDKPLTNAPKIIECYLTGAQTNYNPNIMSFFEDGKFTEITLNLTFIEERILVRQDIEEQYKEQAELDNPNLEVEI